MVFVVGVSVAADKVWLIACWQLTSNVVHPPTLHYLYVLSYYSPSLLVNSYSVCQCSLCCIPRFSVWQSQPTEFILVDRFRKEGSAGAYLMQSRDWLDFVTHVGNIWVNCDIRWLLNIPATVENKWFILGWMMMVLNNTWRRKTKTSRTIRLADL